MGLLEIPEGANVYMDANCLIYQIEKVSPFCELATPLWNLLDTDTVKIVSSELTYLEALTLPVKKGDGSLILRYLTTMRKTKGLSLLPLNTSVLTLAVRMRARHNLKTPDAIHAATALLCHCNLFITNDPIFKRVSGLEVVVLSELMEE
jgi:predicted nucleic acid-binding protein